MLFPYFLPTRQLLLHPLHTKISGVPIPTSPHPLKKYKKTKLKRVKSCPRGRPLIGFLFVFDPYKRRMTFVFPTRDRREESIINRSRRARPSTITAKTVLKKKIKGKKKWERLSPFYYVWLGLRLCVRIRRTLLSHSCCRVAYVMLSAKMTQLAVCVVCPKTKNVELVSSEVLKKTNTKQKVKIVHKTGLAVPLVYIQIIMRVNEKRRFSSPLDKDKSPDRSFLICNEVVLETG